MTEGCMMPALATGAALDRVGVVCNACALLGLGMKGEIVGADCSSAGSAARVEPSAAVSTELGGESDLVDFSQPTSNAAVPRTEDTFSLGVVASPPFPPALAPLPPPLL
jgi:hypothetical protein